MWERARWIATFLEHTSRVHIITHIDADGISAGAIAARACERAGKEVDVEFLKQLDSVFVSELLANHDPSVVYWFTDLGAAYSRELGAIDRVITDHHELKREMIDVPRDSRMDLMAFSRVVTETEEEDTLHLNPHFEGIDGSTSISGAGLAYMVAREMDPKNIDLAHLAIVGAVGDFQSSEGGHLVGLNREILADAVDSGELAVRKDLCLFGRETRPLHQFLMYATEPAIPTLARDEAATMHLLREMDIEWSRKDDPKRPRHWVDLDDREQKRIISAIAELFMVSGGGVPDLKKVIGENYILVNERKGSALHDAKEFSTLLNSCGRYGYTRAGLEVCLGDRGKWLKEAEGHMKNHRRNLSGYIQLVQARGIEQRGSIQWTYVGPDVPEEVIGIVAGMVLGSGELDRSRPLLAIADSDEGGTKVSARADRALVDRGLDLSRVMKEACEEVGGHGGGHNIAAGGNIPASEMERFLDIAESMISRMLE